MTGRATAGKTRRKPGEGGVRWQESRQRFVAEKTVGYDVRGKRIVKSGYGKSQSAALRALADKVKAYEDGLTPDYRKFTVAQAVDQWMHAAQHGLAPKTVRGKQDMYRLHIEPYLGARRIVDLRAEELDLWLDGLAENLGESALKQCLAVLRGSLRMAVKRGHAERNVAELVVVPKGRAGRPSKAMMLDQAQALIDGTMGHRMYSYIVFSLATGARTEEVRALKWDRVHLDVENPYVEVWRSARFGGDPKTEKSRRTLALAPMAVDALRSQLEWQDECRATNPHWRETGIVFSTRNGTMQRAENVLRQFRHALAQVPGIDPEEWTPRELRHTFVSILSYGGERLEEIARLLGHTNSRTTEVVYRKELRPVLDAGAIAIESALGNSPSAISSAK